MGCDHHVVIWLLVIMLSHDSFSSFWKDTSPFPVTLGMVTNSMWVHLFFSPFQLEFIFCPDSSASHGQYPMCVLLSPDWELAPELPCATQWPRLSSVNTLLFFSAYTLHPHVFQEFYFCLCQNRSLKLRGTWFFLKWLFYPSADEGWSPS